MLRNLKTYFEYGNRFCGVEHTLENGCEIIYATLLKKNKKAVDIENIYKENNIEKLKNKLPKKQAVFLIINNDQVLTKSIESKQSEILKLVYNAFPNINLDDFFYEVMPQGDFHLVSICRKVYVKELIDTFTQLGFFVFDVSLGNTIVSNVTRFINSKTILTSNASISIENETITSIEKIETNETIHYDVNGLTVSNNHLLSLSGALNPMVNHFLPVTNFDILKQSLKNVFKQSRFYTQFLKFGLVFLLAILLVNFFIFNYYFDKLST